MNFDRDRNLKFFYIVLKLRFYIPHLECFRNLARGRLDGRGHGLSPRLLLTSPHPRHPDLRQYDRQPIQNRMENHPQVLNYREYSQQIGILLMRLYQQNLRKQP